MFVKWIHIFKIIIRMFIEQLKKFFIKVLPILFSLIKYFNVIIIIIKLVKLKIKLI